MLKFQYFGHLMQRTDSLEKTLMLGKTKEEKRMTEDELVGWQYQLSGHEFEHALGDGGGQGSLACCIQCGSKKSATEQQPLAYIKIKKKLKTLIKNSLIQITLPHPEE